MYPVGFGYMDSARWALGPSNGIPPAYRYASSPITVNFNANLGEDHDYEIVAVNVLLEDGVPSDVLTVRCYGTPNLRLYWSPAPGAVRYKVLRDRLLIVTLGAIECKDEDYPNFQSYYDRGSQDAEAYTRRVIQPQLVLPFQTTTQESWSPPSQS